MEHIILTIEEQTWDKTHPCFIDFLQQFLQEMGGSWDDTYGWLPF
jgi:hypothetical protein